MFNCAKFKFKENGKGYENGLLVAIEGERDIPFNIKRIYYIYGVPSHVERGFHSHKKLHQVLICVHGSVKVKVKNQENEEVFILQNPSEGLYIGNMVWREMFDFSEGAVLLALASEYYTEEDYIRDIEIYDKESTLFF